MIPLFKVFMSPQAKYDVADVLDSGFIGQGKKNDELEAAFRERIDHDYVVALNSATSAEHLAWLLLKRPNPQTNWRGLQEGDEVLLCPLTCFATTTPILLNGLKVKWVDVDPETLNIDLDDLCRKISPTTRAAQIVHWGGYPVDLDRIKEIQNETKEVFGFKLAVCEDAAHAFGSKYKGRPIGTHGNITTFSLQAIKHVTSVDGALMTLPHKELYDRATRLRWYGIDRKSDIQQFRCYADVEEYGSKWHMNDVSATVGLANLKFADWIISCHQRNAALYDKELRGVSGVKLLKRDKGFESSFWIYSMLVERREDFMKMMKEKGIQTSQVHERNDKYSCVKEFKTHLPTLDKITKNIVSIPVGWWVEEAETEKIISAIKGGW